MLFLPSDLFTKLYIQARFTYIPPDHLLLDSTSNLGPLISRWEINKFGNFGYKSVGISEVLKLLFQYVFKFVQSPTRYEWSNIRGPVH